MKSKPKVGDVGEIEFRVESAHAIDFADNGMPEVLCTPWLIWFLEHAAREAMLPLLDKDESTVGVYVEVQHTAATPVGERVRCQARIIRAEGTQVTFQLDAFDEHERIARGMHRLRVIRVNRFAERLGTKSP